MEFRELVAFVAVAESGSVRAAAERLHLSQPALTRRIQRLEESLGVALVEVNGVHRQLSMVARGLGLGFMPDLVVRESPLRSRLRPLEIPGRNARLPIWMMQRPVGAVLDPVIRQLASYVRRRLRTTPPAK